MTHATAVSLVKDFEKNKFPGIVKTQEIKKAEAIVKNIYKAEDYKPSSSKPVCSTRIKTPGKPHHIPGQNQMIADLVKFVSEDFKITPAQLKARTRRYEILLPRQICQYIAHVIYGITQQVVAQETGITDHSTVNNAVKSIHDLMATRPIWKKKIEGYINELQK